MKMPVCPPHDHGENFYNDNNEFEILVDVAIGDAPTQPGTGGTWSTSYDSAATTILCQAEYLGKLYAGGDDGNIYVQDEGVWALAYDSAEDAPIYHLAIHNGELFACSSVAYHSPIYRTSDGVNWSKVGELVSAPILGLLSFGGALWAASNGGYGVLHYSIDGGVTWTESDVTPWSSTKHASSLCLFGDNLYVVVNGAYGAEQSRVYRYSGVAWSIVFSVAIYDYFQYNAIIVWNGKMYIGAGAGKIYVTTDGTNFTEATDLGTGATRAFVEYNGKLLAAYEDKIYDTPDGTTWTLFYDSAEAAIYSLILYEASLYAGTGSAGKVLAYTDATYIPAPNLQVFGDIKLWGQLKPGDSAGAAGDLLMSGGADHPNWLPKGDDDEVLTLVAGLPSWEVPVTGIIADGDKGDITVTAGGETWTIDDDAVTYAKMQNVSAADKVLGSVAGGNVEEIACTAAGRALIDDEGAAAQATTLGLGTTDGPSFNHLHVTGTGGVVGTAANAPMAIVNPTNTGVSHVGGGGSFVTLTDNQTMTMTIGYVALFHIYNGTTGNNYGALFFAEYKSATIVKLADPSNAFEVTDTDTAKIAVFKGAASGIISIKNYCNADRRIIINCLGPVASATAPA